MTGTEMHEAAEALARSEAVRTRDLLGLISPSAYAWLPKKALVMRQQRACADFAQEEEAMAWDGLSWLLALSPDRRCAQRELLARVSKEYGRNWILTEIRDPRFGTYREQSVLWAFRSDWMRAHVASRLEELLERRSDVDRPCRHDMQLPSCRVDTDIVLTIETARVVGLVSLSRSLLQRIAASAEFGRNRVFAAGALAYASGVREEGLQQWRRFVPAILADMPWLAHEVRLWSEALESLVSERQYFDDRVEEGAHRFGLATAILRTLIPMSPPGAPN
jgi:hypothetical protein